MSHLSLTTRRRSGRGGPRRWQPADPARYLADFARSGQSAVAFCRGADVPLSTFTLWQRQARTARERPAPPHRFAVVEEVDPRPIESPAAITMRVRGAAGAEAELTGLDPATAVRLVRVLIVAPPTR